MIYDYDIRKLVYEKILDMDIFISDSTTKLINELDVCFGVSRIDIAVVNGQLHGYEIKSERDTLDRLPSQVESYNEVFDTVTIVVGEKHLSKINKIIPEWWGIYYISEDNGKLQLIEKRTPKINTNVKILELCKMLWKPELMELLEQNGIRKGIKSKNRFTLCKMVADKIQEQIVKEFVREKLKSRENWRAVSLQQLYDDLQQ